MFKIGGKEGEKTLLTVETQFVNNQIITIKIENKGTDNVVERFKLLLYGYLDGQNPKEHG